MAHRATPQPQWAWVPGHLQLDRETAGKLCGLGRRAQQQPVGGDVNDRCTPRRTAGVLGFECGAEDAARKWKRWWEALDPGAAGAPALSGPATACWHHAVSVCICAHPVKKRGRETLRAARRCGAARAAAARRGAFGRWKSRKEGCLGQEAFDIRPFEKLTSHRIFLSELVRSGGERWLRRRSARSI